MANERHPRGAKKLKETDNRRTYRIARLTYKQDLYDEWLPWHYSVMRCWKYWRKTQWK